MEVWDRAGDDVYAVGTFGGIYHYDGAAGSVLQAGGLWGAGSGDV